jgi:hypothetical protein
LDKYYRHSLYKLHLLRLRSIIVAPLLVSIMIVMMMMIMMIIITVVGIIIYYYLIIIFQFFSYIRAVLTAQWPVTKYTRVRKKRDKLRQLI